MMKKAALVGICTLITATSFAQSNRVDRDDVLNRRREFAREQKIEQIKELALQVSVLTASRIITLDDADLDALKDALQSSKRILRGRNTPNPVPTPPRPVEKYLSCDEETTKNLDFATKKRVTALINDIADDEFEMSWLQAENFAAQWMQKYPCEVAETYAANAKALNSAADNYLGFSWVQAGNYAKEKVDLLCDATTLVQSAREINQYADHELGMNWVQAENYAKDWVEANLLNCQLPKAGDIKP
ncbi:MAG: hypothetical protein CME60_14475 [Halobacteriovoraceae bacterium]|nr:hypothetical protein [Halobacteriovoraceae bacterium]